ncbi:MAG TPA: hypothetical protein VJ827_01605, partial [Rubrobacter sp.]|nr:hypothetical protein [Rubrobacter sp.]
MRKDARRDEYEGACSNEREEARNAEARTAQEPRDGSEAPLTSVPSRDMQSAWRSNPEAPEVLRDRNSRGPLRRS